MNNDALVLHVCCAPCLITALTTVQDNQEKAFSAISEIFFYNPNIHPLLEFRRRVKALQVYLERNPLSAEIDAEYGLRSFLACVAPNGKVPPDRRDRCYHCYMMRLTKTAEYAANKNIWAFSSTLLASREQDRDLVTQAGQEAARKYNIKFVTGDLRRILPDEKLLRGIYKQQYCGCLFSEEERFANTNKHLYGQ